MLYASRKTRRFASSWTRAPRPSGDAPHTLTVGSGGSTPAGSVVEVSLEVKKTPPKTAAAEPCARERHVDGVPEQFGAAHDALEVTVERRSLRRDHICNAYHSGGHDEREKTGSCCASCFLVFKKRRREQIRS